ncbi:hypothetical protein P167DRAFT_541447 [Morchella conica CCBAS932]|uniref:Uncharacterized protein n=1 Tax=Morchella conica CCBAS932 TaxID=1392247 RepID=A0A3N4L9S6_9PEZI|nr:hypothetical protein P167DRAFT_541447 [Morchella conica CCBAS932]
MASNSINSSRPELSVSGTTDSANNSSCQPAVEISASDNAAAAAAIQQSGTVGIVYIANSLFPALPPRINETYGIVKAWSAQDVPQLGAQLRRCYGERIFLCGWIKKDDNAIILQHLESQSPISRVYGKVTDTEPFWWQECQCYWGTMDWWVCDSEVNESEGGQIM